MHANPSVPISSAGSSAAAGSGNTPTSAASTTSTTTATTATATATTATTATTTTTRASTATAAVEAFAGAVHVGIGARYRPRQQQMTGSGTLDSAVQPLSAVSDSAAKLPLTPSAIHASDVVAATAAVSDATHTRESSLTNVNPATPPPLKPATVVPTSGSGSISSNASVNSTTTKTSAGAAATASTTPSSISSTGSSSSSSSPATTTADSTSTSHTTPSKTLPFLPPLTTRIVLPALDTIVPMAQKQLIRSKDATVAFFYRTFSPTYRISQLYVDSWSNGSQKRGLERIQKAFLEGNAFTLVKAATSNMKDVWQQVKDAYKVKSANAKAEKARRLSKSAKGGK